VAAFGNRPFAICRGQPDQTPAEISELNLGSRPPSRRASARVEDLRAIPRVLGWGRCRVSLPDWCGFGTAVKAWLDEARFLDVDPGAESGTGTADGISVLAIGNCGSHDDRKRIRDDAGCACAGGVFAVMTQRAGVNTADWRLRC
jgi:hypothetical protein